MKNLEADAKARAAGLDSVMDRCVKIEHARLFGGLALGRREHALVSAKRPQVSPPTLAASLLPPAALSCLGPAERR